MGHAQTRDAHTSHKHGTKRELTAMEFGSTRGTSVASYKTPRDYMQYASLGSLSAEPANTT